MSSTLVVIHGARTELINIHEPTSSTVNAGAASGAPMLMTGTRFAAAAASSIALVTTAAITQPNGQQTNAIRPSRNFCATPLIGRSMKKERKIGLIAQPAVRRTPPINFTTYCTPQDSQPKIHRNAYDTAVPIDSVPQMMSQTLEFGSAAVFPAMNWMNRLSTVLGSTPIIVPNAITMSFKRISHSRRKAVLSPMMNTFAIIQMKELASGRLRTV